MRLRALLASAVLLSASLLAHADSYSTFDLTSTFVGYAGQSGGGSISGTLTLDNTLGYFTGVYLTASGFPGGDNTTLDINGVSGGNYFGSTGVFVSGEGATLDLYLMVSDLTDYAGSGICSQSSSPSCYFNDLSSYLPAAGGVFVASSGTLEPETMAPTPEPSGFLLLATGLLGIAVLSGRMGWDSFRRHSQ